MPIPAPGAGRRRSTLGGATLWIVAGIGYLALEAGAAAGRPQYSYARNYISDLGVTTSRIDGQVVHVPGAHLMNTAFCVQGTMFLAAAILVAHGLRIRRPGLFLGFAAMNAAGNILVATVPAGQAADAGGFRWLHAAGAVVAIVGGNAAVLAGSRLVRAAGGTPWYRTVSVAVGVLGFLCLLMLRVDSATSTFEILPDGVWERGSVYSIIGWQLLTGFCLLAWSFDTRD